MKSQEQIQEQKRHAKKTEKTWNKAQGDGLSAKDVGEMGFHREFHDLEGPVCSAGDCTGLIPTPPQSDAQEEAYEELYPFLQKAAPPERDRFS